MQAFKLFYIVLLFTAMAAFAALLVSALRSKRVVVNELVLSYSSGLLFCIIYLCYILAGNIFRAQIYCTVYHTMMSWMCFGMLFYSLRLTGRHSQFRKGLAALMGVLFCDSVSMLANIWHGHAFTVFINRTSYSFNVYDCHYTGWFTAHTASVWSRLFWQLPYARRR